jgi:hypothetical protein
MLSLAERLEQTPSWTKLEGDVKRFRATGRRRNGSWLGRLREWRVPRAVRWFVASRKQIRNVFWACGCTPCKKDR